jgi:hypothetical protein
MPRRVDVGDAVAEWWLDQAAQPDARAEDVFRVAGLIATGAAAERGQDRAVAAVLADGEVVEPQFGQCAAQLAIRRHQGMDFRHLAEGVVAQV